jgi:hypothetical protein
VEEWRSGGVEELGVEELGSGGVGEWRSGGVEEWRSGATSTPLLHPSTYSPTPPTLPLPYSPTPLLPYSPLLDSPPPSPYNCVSPRESKHNLWVKSFAFDNTEERRQEPAETVTGWIEVIAGSMFPGNVRRVGIRRVNRARIRAGRKVQVF